MLTPNRDHAAAYAKLGTDEHSSYRGWRLGRTVLWKGLEY